VAEVGQWLTDLAIVASLGIVVQRRGTFSSTARLAATTIICWLGGLVAWTWSVGRAPVMAWSLVVAAAVGSVVLARGGRATRAGSVAAVAAAAAAAGGLSHLLGCGLVLVLVATAVGGSVAAAVAKGLPLLALLLSLCVDPVSASLGSRATYFLADPVNGATAALLVRLLLDALVMLSVAAVSLRGGMRAVAVDVLLAVVVVMSTVTENLLPEWSSASFGLITVSFIVAAALVGRREHTFARSPGRVLVAGALGVRVAFGWTPDDPTTGLTVLPLALLLAASWLRVLPSTALTHVAGTAVSVVAAASLAGVAAGYFVPIAALGLLPLCRGDAILGQRPGVRLALLLVAASPFVSVDRAAAAGMAEALGLLAVGAVAVRSSAAPNASLPSRAAALLVAGFVATVAMRLFALPTEEPAVSAVPAWLALLAYLTLAAAVTLDLTLALSPVATLTVEMAAEATAATLALASVGSLYDAQSLLAQQRNADAARRTLCILVAAASVASTVTAHVLAKRTAVAAARAAAAGVTRDVRRAGIPVSASPRLVAPPHRPTGWTNTLVNVRLAFAYACALAAVYTNEWGVDAVSPWAIVGASLIFTRTWTTSTVRPTWWPSVAVSVVVLLVISWWNVLLNPWQLNTLAATLSTIAAGSASGWAAKGFITPADSLAVPTLAIIASACAASSTHIHLANALCAVPVARVAIKYW
jgi:hypothetical protein